MGRFWQIGLFALVIHLAAPAYAQKTVYVNGTTGDDTWDGLCEEWDGGICGPKATIQAGINAAADGDTVLVADAVYTGVGNRDLDFWGLAIVVRSVGGADNCVIDCQSFGRGFRFWSGETNASVVEGFTIQGGSIEDYGAGIYCGYGSSPTVTDCTITGNTAGGDGGGVACTASSAPVLTNCTISDNTAGSDGGGVYCDDNSSPTLTNCTITGNSGGGVYCDDSSSPTVADCTITGNSGGGVYCDHNSSPTVADCTINGNSGGVVCYYDSSPTLTNCTINGNSGGSGVYCGEDSRTYPKTSFSSNIVHPR